MPESPAGDKCRVFISHAHADLAQARALKTGLGELNIQGWLAPDDMVGRDSWTGELVAEIERCDALVVLVSSTSVESKHVEREVTLALEHDRPILPVMLEEVTLSGPLAYLLSSRHRVQAVGGVTEPTARLIADRVLPEGGAAASRSTGGRGKVSWDESRVPVPLDPIIGRRALVESVVDAVREGRRLITLRGPGGVGKTRVSLAVAQRVSELELAAVVFADLAEATTADELMVGIANALGYSGPEPRDPVEVAKTLSNERLLLICDNLEQVASRSAPLHHLLQAAPAITALVTSRTRLGLAGEQVVVVPPLELKPNDIGASEAATPAVEMFLQVARHTDPSYLPAPHELADIDQVCKALDGLPLALELAASRLSLMTPAQLLQRVGGSASIVGTRAAPGGRHDSVEATIGWSLSLLSPEALGGFARLGIFAGGFTLEAVEEVCAGDDETAAAVDRWLAELIDASVVQSADAPSGRRFFMLQLLTAEARRRQVDPGLGIRHATYFAELAERLGPEMAGPQAARVTRGLTDDLANWSQALAWTAEHDPHLYVRLARGWRKVWVSSMRPAEALGSPLSAESRAQLSPLESAVLLALSAMAASLAGAPKSLDEMERAVERSADLEPDPQLLVLLWSFLADARRQVSDREGARDAAATARAYASELGSVHDRAVANDISGWIAIYFGDRVAARAFAEEAIELAESLGDDSGVCFALATLGSVLVEEGDEAALRSVVERMLTLVEQGRALEANHMQAQFLLRMADMISEDWPSVAQSLQHALTRPSPLPIDVVGDLLTAAALLCAVGRLDEAHEALASARSLAERLEVDIGEPEMPLREHLARLDVTPGALTARVPETGPLVPSGVLEALRQVVDA